MKIKVISCSGQYWYRHHIGEIFEVEEYSDTKYRVVEGTGYFEKPDCEIVEEKEKPKMKFTF